MVVQIIQVEHLVRHERIFFHSAFCVFLIGVRFLDSKQIVLFEATTHSKSVAYSTVLSPS